MVDIRVHLEQADGVNGGHSELSGNPPRNFLNLCFKAFETGQQLATSFKIPLPGWSESQWSVASVDQLKSQLLFEMRHSLTDGRLGDPTSIRRLRKATALCDFAEEFEIAKGHEWSKYK